MSAIDLALLCCLLASPGDPADQPSDIKDLRLKDWEPRPMLKVKETRIEKPAFPVIDVHNHLRNARDVSQVVAQMDAAGVRTVVHLDGGWGEKLRENLKRFEAPGGVLTSTETTGNQWDAPFGWAPLQIIAVDGLRRYGHHEAANRLARKFVGTVVKEFEEHGVILEKYDLVRRESDVAGGIRFGYSANQVGFGWTNAAIAKARGTSVHTVANQVHQLLQKHQQPSRRALIATLHSRDEKPGSGASGPGQSP